MKRAILLGAGGLLAIILLQTNTQSGTESTMLAWGQALNVHLTTGGTTGNYDFPETLSEIAPELRADLSFQDVWGNKLKYRRLRDDKYQLISVGKDGVYGNEDDVILMNGALYPADTIYAETPP